MTPLEWMEGEDDDGPFVRVLLAGGWTRFRFYDLDDRVRERLAEGMGWPEFRSMWLTACAMDAAWLCGQEETTITRAVRIVLEVTDRPGCMALDKTHKEVVAITRRLRS